MKISAKTDYALKALLELSLHWPKQEPLQIHAIAKKHKISIKFLIHIMIQLKQMGYVQSLRGKKGGYVLIKAPKDIILSEVLIQFGELDLNITNPKKGNNKSDIFENIWRDANSILLEYFSSINFDEFVKRARSMESINMYSIPTLYSITSTSMILSLFYDSEYSHFPWLFN